MTRIRSILRALMLIGLSCHSSLALGTNDVAECCLHPDPHIYSFHGIGYDYQHGCDNILVDLPNLKVHARFVKYQFTAGSGFSYIEGVGIESGGDNLYIKSGGTYFLNDPTMTTPITAAPGVLAPIGTLPLPFSINALSTWGSGFEYVIEFPNVAGFPAGTFAIRIEDYSALATGGDKDYGVSMCITGHGSFFAGSKGMCGTWNQFTGLHDRLGNDMFPTLTTTSPWSTVLDGGPFGDHWQSTFVEAIMPPAVGIPGGHNMYPAACVARRRSLAEEEGEIVHEQEEMEKNLAVVDEEENRELTTACPYCETLKHPYAIDNCLYDANVIGCSAVESTFKMFYNKKSRYYKTQYKKLTPIPCEKFHPDAMYSDSKCEAKKGGRCVRYCDTRDNRIKCISGKCNECKFPIGKGKTVLLLGRYINGCSCMYRKKGFQDTTYPDETDVRDP